MRENVMEDAEIIESRRPSEKVGLALRALHSVTVSDHESGPLRDAVISGVVGSCMWIYMWIERSRYRR